MTLISNKPDAYGPMWISSSLVFSLAVTSHISSWMAAQSTGNQWWVMCISSILSILSNIAHFWLI